VTPFAFNTSASILFGSGEVAKLGTLARARLGKKILFVTDQGVLRAGLADHALQALRDAGCDLAIFDAVVADPPEEIVLDCAAMAQACDGVIGFGGGSSMDVAKLAALLAKSGETLAAIYGVGLAKGPRLPLMLVPTTAGTGSEVTPISIVTTGTNEKKGVVSPIILPDIALLDPDLTLGLPPHVTAATGIDAMVHAIEAYASKSANNNPVSKILAREALRLMGANILAAVRDGANKDARGAMLLGAMLAGQAFANSPVAAVHALAYPLGGHYHIPHGLSNALVLPHVLRFNAPDAGTIYAEIAVDAFPELSDIGTQARADAFADHLHRLAEECGLSMRLREHGVTRDSLPLLAEDAMKQTRLLVNNPRPLTYENALAIYEKAW
jgi:alcohol dehydrogenase class IV